MNLCTEKVNYRTVKILKKLCLFIILITASLTLTSCSGKRLEEANKKQEKADLYYKMGEMEFERRNFPIALQNLHMSEELDPKSTSTQNLLGLSYFARRMYPEAEKHFKKALDMNTTFSSARMNLGALYLETKRWDKAIYEYDILLKDVYYQTPETVYNNKGWALYNKGDYAGALVNYKKAVDINGQYQVAYNNMGLVYEKLKKTSLAIESYEKSLRISEHYIDANYHLGKLLLRKDKKKARELMNKVIQIAPESEMAKSAKDYLRLLK